MRVSHVRLTPSWVGGTIGRWKPVTKTVAEIRALDTDSSPWVTASQLSGASGQNLPAEDELSLSQFFGVFDDALWHLGRCASAM